MISEIELTNNQWLAMYDYLGTVKKGFCNAHSDNCNVCQMEVEYEGKKVCACDHIKMET